MQAVQTEIKRIIQAYQYTKQGLIYAWNNEAPFRTEVILLPPIILAAFILPIGASGALWVIGSWLLVMAIELLNSAIEAVVDRISTERHPLSGHAKDLGSAAVFMGLAFHGLVWFVLLLQWLF